MKKLIYKIKNIDFNKNLILKIFLTIFLIIFYIFIGLNYKDILYLSAGYDGFNNASMQIYIFDVGQATSVCVILPDDKVWILDTGSLESSDKLIDNLDYILDKNKINKIDTLLLSHSDLDHIGGAVDILNKYQVKNILRPKILSEDENSLNGYKVVYSEEYKKLINTINQNGNYNTKFIENDIIEDENYQIKIYAGEKDYYSQTNSYSPIVTFSCSQKTFMFTGDVTDIREKEFAENFSEKIDVDYLLISHHGSSYSTTDTFLSVINPQYAFVSCGSYLYPSQEVVTRLNNVNIKNIYSTFNCGLIGIFVNENSCFKMFFMANAVDLPLLVVLISFLFFFCIKHNFFENKMKLRYF